MYVVIRDPLTEVVLRILYNRVLVSRKYIPTILLLTVYVNLVRFLQPPYS